MTAYPHPSGERRLTIEEFERLPDDGQRSELVRGRVVREPPAGFEHGGVAMDIGRRIAEYVHRHGLGRVFAAETGFVLSRDPPTVRAPDAAFVASGRLPAGRVTGFARFAPDLAVEVLSASNGEAELEEKVRDYVDAGTRLVWVADPAARAVSVYRPGGDRRVLAADEFLDGGDVLPGFRVRVAELFGG